MPSTTICPRCEKAGFVRYENVIKGGFVQRHFYCGSCNHSWAVSGDGKTRHNYGRPPERSRAGNKT
jgi:transposase-like protein